MNVQTTKIELAKLILNIENPALIARIKELLIKETGDFWLTLSETEKEEIKFGIQQLDSGSRIPIEDFFNKIS